MSATVFSEELSTNNCERYFCHRTKCCYGLSMDLLENIATELGFEFHLYIVRDELYGAKYADPSKFTQQSSGGDSAWNRRSGRHERGDTYSDILSGDSEYSEHR